MNPRRLHSETIFSIKSEVFASAIRDGSVPEAVYRVKAGQFPGRDQRPLVRGCCKSRPASKLCPELCRKLCRFWRFFEESFDKVSKPQLLQQPLVSLPHLHGALNPQVVRHLVGGRDLAQILALD